MKLLSENFLANYPDEPNHMNELAKFVFYRTYSRWMPNKQRRETFKEAIKRAVEYNVSIEYEHLIKQNIPVDIDNLKKEAKELFDNIFNLKQFLSGRTHWIGGANSKVADKFPLANFNCAFIDVTSWKDLTEMFYLLLVGTGVGFRCSKENAKNLPPIRTDYKLIHSEYNPLPPNERLENTEVTTLKNGYAKIYVGDSKEGWVNALGWFLSIITDSYFEEIKNIKISYNSIRPKGERLKTFGGQASGHTSLKEMFNNIDKLFKDNLDPYTAPLDPLQEFEHEADPKWKIVRPIHILDIGNLIGNNVVVGGVRRTAEIFLCDSDDWESIFAKYGINGIWDVEKHKQIIQKMKDYGYYNDTTSFIENLPIQDAEARPLHYRRMSNNSIIFEEKPSNSFLDLIFTIIQQEGEPGIVNLESAKKRRPNAKGINPCGEVLLDSYGVCNLTTVNVMNYISKNEETDEYKLNLSSLIKAQKLSAKAGLRMTCLDLELEKWNEVQKRDRLIGSSLTGWQDAMSLLNYSTETENKLKKILKDTAEKTAIDYSKELRIPIPLLSTTIKPEGTLSQVANGTSSGLHYSYAPYYIRRIRINSHDPLAKIALKLDWRVNPEVGTKGKTHDERIKNATTYVIDFPVKSGTSITSDEISARKQLENYFRFQENYVTHNASNTITVKENEWNDVRKIIENNWDKFIGVTFLPHDGGSYELAPYEQITKEEYEKLKESMEEFSFNLIQEFESEETELDIENIQGCDGGNCPVI